MKEVKEVKRKQVDMHIHSNYSDGDCSIDELIKRIKEAGLRGAVLTDHDSVDGVRKFLSLCDNLGIDTMTGIEVSSTYCRLVSKQNLWKTELHMLGYGYNLETLSKDYKLLHHNQVIRNHHVEAMIMKYRTNREFIVSFVELTRQFDIPWPLISKYWLVKSRTLDILKTEDMDFAQARAKAIREITNGGPFYVERGNYISPKEAIELITSHNGIAVWAHPLICFRKIEKSFGKNAEAIFEEILKELTRYGLYGLEIHTQHHTKEDRGFLLKYCAKYNLAPNFGGSDYHGDRYYENSPGIYLGKGGISYNQFLQPKKKDDNKA